MADFYDIDFGLQTEHLLNPLHQDQINLDYMLAMAQNLQLLRDKFFSDYRLGAKYLDYSVFTNYVPLRRVVFTDNCVYENKLACIAIPPTGNTLSTDHWVKIQDNYIGSDERSLYSGQLISLAYHINKWYNCESPSLIYFVPNLAAGIGFAIHIPLAVYNTLGATNGDRNNNISQYLARYIPAGTTNQIVTY